ncbi:MAG: hypothetical protein Unbinned2990contig1002_33 [Prokaryotic dsDNA virus sp.]|nr:MAG: hypothetical protein Unbinned2990contig1002_33 [Prokaryotic dsDNA virus sp.]|tara:strand:+ start:10050 stop:10460 length:411 start_codon:yes stop_codon:yes gene_type:complete
MIVEVRQEHIDEGKQGDPCYCAVSLAVKEALMHKYKFSDSNSLTHDDGKLEVLLDESWVETAIQGAGAEISIYTKVFNTATKKIDVVEDFIVIEDERSVGVMMNDIVLEGWIENFDTFNDSEPISFKVEDIHRMNN